MNDCNKIPLLVGEIFIDFTITAKNSENKLRLGGITHAARGLWAIGVAFRVAAILPDYLIGQAREYLTALGCVEFNILGTVQGAPNIIVIGDVTEVADQAYETLLRDEKSVILSAVPIFGTAGGNAIIFPGTYDLQAACSLLPDDTILNIDVAYDVASPNDLDSLGRKVETIFISTSSQLFKSISFSTFGDLLNTFKTCSPQTIVLKENRGGTRLMSAPIFDTLSLPAQLGTTVNSVGVGDVFAAVYVALREEGLIMAGWKATYASAAYSQTTDPNLFRTYLQRDLALTLEEMQDLGGTVLHWEDRQVRQIYFAAPDFADADRLAIDQALASLAYHNFKVRRPILEIGEVPPGSSFTTLLKAYHADHNLLKQCDLVFAVPTCRDPGTLVEIGLAIEANIPVVVYDPALENANTMVIAGSSHYSESLDSCLNAVFNLLSVGQT